MKKAGERVESAGRETRKYYGGEAEEPEAAPVKKWWRFW